MDDMVEGAGWVGGLSGMVGRQSVSVLRRFCHRSRGDSAGEGRRKRGRVGIRTGKHRTVSGGVGDLEWPGRRWFLDVCPRPQHARGLSAELGIAVKDCEGTMSKLRLAPCRLTQKIGFALSVVALLLRSKFIGVFGIGRSYAQANDRRVVTRVEPDYPDALKKLYIGGVVRVEVQVAPNGSVKNIKLLGGNPILGQSTIKAVKMWKYVPAPADETLTVKLEFDPHK